MVCQVVPGMLPLVKQECLPGYSPFGEECTCQETEEIALCLADRRGLLLAVKWMLLAIYWYVYTTLTHTQNGLWGAPPDYSRTLVTHTCPPGYCQCSGRESQRSEGCLLLYTEPNHICQDKREGTCLTDASLLPSCAPLHACRYTVRRVQGWLWSRSADYLL